MRFDGDDRKRLQLFPVSLKVLGTGFRNHLLAGNPERSKLLPSIGPVCLPGRRHTAIDETIKRLRPLAYRMNPIGRKMLKPPRNDRQILGIFRNDHGSDSGPQTASEQLSAGAGNWQRNPDPERYGMGILETASDEAMEQILLLRI